MNEIENIQNLIYTIRGRQLMIDSDVAIPTLKVAKTDKFHDRFMVIDNKELYHIVI